MTSDGETLRIGEAPLPRGPVPFAERLAGWERYRLGPLLGAGGMGQVYRAFDTALKRDVALKFLLGDEPVRLARFVREAQAQAKLDHPSICRVWEVGEVAGMPYIAMQLIAGEPLDRAAPGLTSEQLVVIARQVAEALHAAHRVGLIHRDVKPANIMVEVTPDGARHPVVVDFGLARDTEAEGLTIADAVVGTPAFMSPEQASGETDRVDRRTDVYSLGATLYQALAGRPPLTAESPLAVMQKVVNDDPPPLRSVDPSIPPDLEAVVMKCLEKEPSRRYDSARALAEDLGRYLDGEPVKAWRAGRLYAARKWARKHRTLVAVSAVAAAAVLASMALWLAARRDVAATAALAQRFGQRVEQVEGMLWRARSLPRHDVRPAKRLARQRLEEIERESRTLGRLAKGPGESALGRGHLALNELDEARAHLRTAWDAGYRPPEVAFALGVALGRLYERELTEIAALRDERERERRKARAREELRAPALVCLRASTGVDVAHPAYLKALLLAYEEQDDEALRHAEEAFSAVPWLFEAKVLQGEVLYRRSLRERIAGRYAEAAAALTQAEGLFDGALAIAESDERVHARRCDAARERVYASTWLLAKGERRDLDRAVEACRAATAVDPDAYEPRVSLASAYASWARLRVESGQRATEELRASIETAKEAMRLRPDLPEAVAHAARGYWMLGQERSYAGGDPRPEYDEGARLARAFLARRPPTPELAGALGLLALDRGLWELEKRMDPRASLLESVEHFRQGVALRPEGWIENVNLGIAWATLLDDDVDTARGDPALSASLALEHVGRALAVNPNLSWAHRTVGDVHMSLARLKLKRGEDPRAEVKASVEAVERSLALHPVGESAHGTLVRAWTVEVAWAVSKGLDPAPALAKGREAARRGLASSEGSLEIRAWLRELEAAARRRP